MLSLSRSSCRATQASSTFVTLKSTGRFGIADLNFNNKFVISFEMDIFSIEMCRGIGNFLLAIEYKRLF